jgi:hypothetical protein
MKHFSIAVLALVFSTTVIAQPERSAYYPTNTTSASSEDVLFWLSGGVGAAGPGFAALLKATTIWDVHSISAKLQHAGTLNFGGGSGTSVTEYSLYYGRQKISPTSIGRIAAGPAYFIKSGPSDPGVLNRFGLGVEAEVIYKFGPFGLGIMGSLMAAPDILYPSVTLNFSIGKLSFSAE